MRILGLNITRANKELPSAARPVLDNRSNWFRIQESFTGAWQKNVEIRMANVLTFSTVYACVTLIASDIGKLCLRLVQEDEETDIWEEVDVPAFSPVLRKPNRYQTRQKFIENWITSKLCYGNTYVLKERDNRNVVTALYILDPNLVHPLVAPDGEVYYQLYTSYLSGIEDDDVSAPSSEIIHDVMVPLYHPLLGVSPITACGLAAVQGLNIQNNSAQFFANGSNPGGIITAPGPITDVHAQRLKDYWQNNYTGNNIGKIAVLGDGLTYQGMNVNATDSKLIDQLKWTSETVCSVFHVPPYMVGVGPPPSYNNVEALNQQYYSQCLQALIESVEALLDEGLGVAESTQGYGTEFDLDDLLRMDTATQYRTYGEGVSRGILAPNEARRKINLPPVKGGDTPYLQQQNYSLAALDKRDTKDDPFAPAKPPVPVGTPKPPTNGQGPKPPAEVAPPPPPKLLADYSKMSGDEMFELLGSAL